MEGQLLHRKEVCTLQTSAKTFCYDDVATVGTYHTRGTHGSTNCTQTKPTVSVQKM